MWRLLSVLALCGMTVRRPGPHNGPPSIGQNRRTTLTCLLQGTRVLIGRLRPRN
jgi:hypothetical protein